MSVELTPNGTRGLNMPKLPRPLMSGLMKLVTLGMKLQRKPVVTITTVGSKSGREHTVDVQRFAESDKTWLVVASMGGAAKHPAWYVNMARNPDKVWAQVEQRRVRVTPVSLKGAERESAWKRIVADSPNFGTYQEKTDREIPVVQLTVVE